MSSSILFRLCYVQNMLMVQSLEQGPSFYDQA